MRASAAAVGGDNQHLQPGDCVRGRERFLAARRLGELLGTRGWAILKAATVVGTFTLLAKVAATVKEGFVAYRLGIAPELDAFLLAFLFPAFLINVISGSLMAAFVPYYMSARARVGASAAAQMIGVVSVRVAGLLLVSALVSAPIFALIIPRVAAGFDQSTIALSQRMVCLLMPLVVLNGTTAFWSGALNAQNRFVLAAATPMITPLVVMGSLAAFWQFLGVNTLIIGTLAGAALEVLVIGGQLRRTGIAPLSLARNDKVDFGQLIAQFLPIAGGSVLLGGTTVVNQMVSATLDPGSVAALSYGTKVTVVIVGISSTALATALLPHFSDMVAKQDVAGIRAVLRQYSVLVFGASLAVTAILLLASESLIHILFERGAFKSQDVQLVSRIQQYYALQIPFFATSMIAVRLLSALRANHVLMIGAAISLLVNLGLNYWLARYLGVAGIALSTSAVYVISCLFLWWSAIRHFRLFVRGARSEQGDRGPTALASVDENVR
jgi:putative peptidoglycan lipid II flippase